MLKTMLAVKLILCGSFVIVFQQVNSDILLAEISSPMSGIDRCREICEKTYSLTSNSVESPESCARGCRFYSIVQLVGNNKRTDLNISRESCQKCCVEGYNVASEKAACELGCDTMSNQQYMILGLMAEAEISWSVFFEDSGSSQVVSTGDMTEPDDVLTDPGLRQQLRKDLIDNAKLPEMRVKTLPVVEHGSQETGVDWWSDCTEHRAGIPRCLATSLLVLLVLIALWFGLTCEEEMSNSSPVVIFDPVELHCQAQKYSLLQNEKA